MRQSRFWRAASAALLAAALAGPAGGAGRDPVAGFWEQCREARPGVITGETYRRRSFGRDQALSTLILDLIRRGEKSATYSLPALYTGDSERTPVVGEFVVVTDLAGQPGAIVQTTALRELTFAGITENESRYDGPTVRPLQRWREVHRAYWTPQLEAIGQALVDATPVTVEYFRLVCLGPE